MTWRVFDTYSTGQESKQLADFISGLPEGRILCLAVKVRPPDNLVPRIYLLPAPRGWGEKKIESVLNS